jgi:kynurenine formamidase
LIDLKRYCIIDLSDEIRPGMYKVGGGFIRGRVPPHAGLRHFEAQQFISIETNTFMWNVEAETHLGTHAECPAHVITEEGKEGGKSAGEIPVEQWFGEAVVVDLTGKGQPITPEDLKMVEEGDIVIMRSVYKKPECPYLTIEGVKYLIEKKVKQICIDETRISVPNGKVHDTLLKNEVILIEGLVNLDKIKKDRVFYIGLGLKWIGLDSGWIRAIVLEEK